MQVRGTANSLTGGARLLEEGQEEEEGPIDVDYV